MQNNPKKNQNLIIIVSSLLTIAIIGIVVYILMQKPFVRTTDPFPLIINSQLNQSIQKYLANNHVTKIFAITGFRQSGKSLLLSTIESKILQNHNLPIYIDFSKITQPDFAESFQTRLVSILSTLVLTKKQKKVISFQTISRGTTTELPKFVTPGLDSIYVTLVDAFNDFYQNDIMNKSSISGIDRFIRIISRYQTLLHPVLLFNDADSLIKLSSDPKSITLKIQNLLHILSQYTISIPIIIEVHNVTRIYASNYSSEFIVDSIAPIQNPSNVLTDHCLFNKAESDKISHKFGGYFYPAAKAFSELPYNDDIFSVISKEAQNIQELVKENFKDPSNPLWDALIKGPVKLNSVKELTAIQPMINSGILTLQKVMNEWELVASCPIVVEQIATLHKKPRATPTPTPKPTKTPKITQSPKPTTKPSSNPTKTPNPDVASENTPAIPAPSTTPKQTPTPTQAPKPAPTPKSTTTPEPTPIPKPTKTPKPTPIPKPSKTPKPTPTPKPSKTPKQTPTPKPSKTPKQTPTPKPTPTPKNVKAKSKEL